jgi:Flp pilus assembly pilin Flp
LPPIARGLNPPPPTMKTFLRFLTNEEGVETMEYAIVASLIVLVAVTAIATIGPKLKVFYEDLAALIP